MRFLIIVALNVLAAVFMIDSKTTKIAADKLQADIAFFIDEAPYVDDKSTAYFNKSRKEFVCNVIESMLVHVIRQADGDTMYGLNIYTAVVIYKAGNFLEDIELVTKFAIRGEDSNKKEVVPWKPLQVAVGTKIDGFMNNVGGKNDSTMKDTSAKMPFHASKWFGRRDAGYDLQYPLLIVRLVSYSTNKTENAKAAAAKLFNIVKDSVDVVVLMIEINDQLKAYVATAIAPEAVLVRDNDVSTKFPPFVRDLLQSCKQPYEPSDCYYVQTVENAPKGENLQCYFNSTYPYVVGNEDRYCWHGWEEKQCEVDGKVQGGTCAQMCKDATWIPTDECIGPCDVDSDGEGGGGGTSVMMIRPGTAPQQWYYDHCVYVGEEKPCTPTCAPTTAMSTTPVAVNKPTTKKAPFDLQEWQIGVIAVAAVAVLAIIIVLIVFLVQRAVAKRRQHNHPPWYSRFGRRKGRGGGGDRPRDNRDTMRRGDQHRRGGGRQEAPSMAPTITESVAPSVTQQQTSIAPTASMGSTAVSRTELDRDRDRRRRR